MTDRELIFYALSARRNAYVPYSGFAVGAALLCRDGTVYTGCNIENAAFTPTVCAERTAFFKAVCAGNREFDRIAICGYRTGEEPGAVCTPCGVCRQVMAEFCDPERFEVICCGGASSGAMNPKDALFAETLSLCDLIRDRDACTRTAEIPVEIYAEKYLLRALLPHGFSGRML